MVTNNADTKPAFGITNVYRSHFHWLLTMVRWSISDQVSCKIHALCGKVCGCGLGITSCSALNRVSSLVICAVSGVFNRMWNELLFVLFEGLAAQAAQDHVMFIVVVRVPGCSVQERPPVSIQHVTWMVFHLLVPPDHVPFPTVLSPLSWPEVSGHVLEAFQYDHCCKFLIALSSLQLAELNIEISDQGQFHTFWSVDKHCCDVLGLGCAVRQGVPPDNKPVCPPSNHLKSEDVGTKGLVHLDFPMEGIFK